MKKVFISFLLTSLFTFFLFWLFLYSSLGNSSLIYKNPNLVKTRVFLTYNIDRILYKHFNIKSKGGVQKYVTRVDDEKTGGVYEYLLVGRFNSFDQDNKILYLEDDWGDIYGFRVANSEGGSNLSIPLTFIYVGGDKKPVPQTFLIDSDGIHFNNLTLSKYNYMYIWIYWNSNLTKDDLTIYMQKNKNILNRDQNDIVSLMMVDNR